jgi:RNA polymerase-binding transcription factor DksA
MKNKSLLEWHIEIRLGLRRELLTAAIQRTAYLIDAVPPDEDELEIFGVGDDASSQFAAHEASILHLNTQLAELSEINAAFKRIADGTFGNCSNCGKPISFERLTCEPTACRCSVCDAHSEKDIATVASTYSF